MKLHTPYLSPISQGSPDRIYHVWNRFIQTIANRLASIFPFLDSNKEQTVWDDLRFPATRGMSNPVTYKPDFDSTNVGLLLDPASEEPIYIIAQLPHSYKPNTNIKPHIHWQSTTSNTNPVCMKMQYKWYNAHQVPPGWTTVYKQVTPPGVAYKSTINTICEIAGTGKSESSIIKIILTRDATNTADTYPADILLDEFDIHFQVEKIGTGNEYPTT